MLLHVAKILFLQTLTALVLVEIILSIQDILHYIMLYFFHMENMGGTGYYS